MNKEILNTLLFYVYIFVCFFVGQEGKCDNLIKCVFEMHSSSEIELNWYTAGILDEAQDHLLVTAIV